MIKENVWFTVSAWELPLALVTETLGLTPTSTSRKEDLVWWDDPNFDEQQRLTLGSDSWTIELTGLEYRQISKVIDQLAAELGDISEKLAILRSQIDISVNIQVFIYCQDLESRPLLDLTAENMAFMASLGAELVLDVQVI